MDEQEDIKDPTKSFGLKRDINTGELKTTWHLTQSKSSPPNKILKL